MDEIIKETIENLEKNNMPTFFVENKREALVKVIELAEENSVVGFGGSVTIQELNVLQELKDKKGCKILNWIDTASKEEVQKLKRENFKSDVFLSSTNAITQDGLLVNVDGTGNRTAAITFGPKKVIIIAGKNKIVKNQEEAIERIRNIAAPMNAKRLNKKTPCVETGKCMDCNSPDKICCTTVNHGWQLTKARINIIIINEELGY